jgi:hypothetical protein
LFALLDGVFLAFDAHGQGSFSKLPAPPANWTDLD